MRITPLVLAAGLLLGTAACSDPKPAAAPSSTPMPPPTAAAAPVPPAHGCYDLSYQAALASTSDARPVDCSKAHTVRTFFVGQADTLTAGGHLLAIDSEKVRRQMATTCPQRFASYVGGNTEERRLSMLSPVWFGPTLKESDEGQSWLRCDVIALASEGRLARLGGRLEKVLDKADGRDRWGRCATAKPGTRNAHQVICSVDHAWRAVATVDVKGGPKGAFPGAKAADAAGAACEDKVRAKASDKLSFTWGWTPPTKAQWDAGQHYGFCWAPGKQ
ncbi:septum formation family protein [Nocardioides jiangxiensis]|uniref:Septum formation family protein n=1 Tax=Nocardioides jiangxiensis TaxID=3064524 RepID=A0ABT9AXB2_9ACTN|nr:septum formation family protein [Nocardioides sp. WY-20]MDO7867171.1 septum formation family protein [Nocardioides sp. WY-20]